MSITIEWLGHACFRITGKDGKRILIDPYDDSLGYRIPDYSCEVLLISHDHFDHAAEQFVPSEHVTIKKAGRFEAEGIVIQAKSFPHDEAGGVKRGKTLAFRFEVDGVVFGHLGDMGAIPTPAEMDFFRGVQALMIPVGGYFTIDASAATKITAGIKPAYVFPMHYKTRAVTLPISNVDDFLKDKSDVERISANSFMIEPGKLPGRPTVILMDYA